MLKQTSPDFYFLITLIKALLRYFPDLLLTLKLLLFLYYFCAADYRTILHFHNINTILKIYNRNGL